MFCQHRLNSDGASDSPVRSDPVRRRRLDTIRSLDHLQKLVAYYTKGSSRTSGLSLALCHWRHSMLSYCADSCPREGQSSLEHPLPSRGRLVAIGGPSDRRQTKINFFFNALEGIICIRKYTAYRSASDTSCLLLT